MIKTLKCPGCGATASRFNRRCPYCKTKLKVKKHNTNMKTGAYNIAIGYESLSSTCSDSCKEE